MAYGLEIFSSNDTLQAGTTVQEGLSVINSGTVANTNSVSYDGSNEILCFNRSTTGWILGTTNSTATSWVNKSGGTVNWLKLKRITTDSSNPDGDDSGDYGIQIFNSDGSTTTYSSNFTKGQEIISVKSPGTVTSTGPEINQAEAIYEDDPTGIYVGVGRMMYEYSTTIYQAYETLYFDYTNDEIRCRNIKGFSTSFTGWIYVPYPNKSSVILFKRIG